MNTLLSNGPLAPPNKAIFSRLLDQPSLRLVNKKMRTCYETTLLEQWNYFLKSDSELKNTFFKTPVTNFTELTTALKPIFRMTKDFGCKPNSVQPNAVAEAYAIYCKTEQDVINGYKALRYYAPNYPEASTGVEIFALVEANDALEKFLIQVMKWQKDQGTTGIPDTNWFEMI